MHPMRRIEEIKSTLEEGEAGATEIRAAARLLEASTPAGEVLAVVAAKEFTATLIARSQNCPAPEERAWLTLAAAGACRARQTLAWRATEALQATEVAEVFVSHRAGLQEECRRRAGLAAEEDAAGAWALLSWLSSRELLRLLHGRPALAGHYRRVLAKLSGATVVSPRLASPAALTGPPLVAGSGVSSFG